MSSEERQDSLLTLRELKKSFGPVTAVSNVNLDIPSKKIVGIVGENGSGKSTLVSLISGIHRKDSGRILLHGKEIFPRTILDSIRYGVGIVTQESNLIDRLSVSENLFIGREKEFIRFGYLRKKMMNLKANALIKKILNRDDIRGNYYVSELSFEDKKLVEIVKAMSFSPSLLIFDETVDALSNKNRELVWSLMKEFCTQDRQTSILYISHTIEEVLSNSEIIVIMKDGELVGTYDAKDVSVENIKMLMVGRKLDTYYQRSERRNEENEKVVLSTRNLTKKGKFEKITIALHRGEILGIGGLGGCGMSELGMTLFGIDKPDDGEILLREGTNGYACLTPRLAIKHNIAYVPKDRDTEGIMLLSNIKENISITAARNLENRIMYISPKKERKLSREAIDMLNIKAINVDQLCIQLSGGNRQKVSLAKWLILNTEILILDCPTRGVDVGVKAYIYSKLDELSKNGVSIIMISDELPELIGMSDRIVIMKNGKQIEKIFKQEEHPKESEIIRYMI
jgi:ribose transport system ATP-binding protein